MLDTFFIIAAKYVFVISLVLGLVWFVRLPRERKRHAVILAVILFPLAFILSRLGAHFYYDPRPFVMGGFAPLIPHAADNGFPSDHVLLASAVAALVTFVDFFWSPWFWLVTIVVALGRVGVGVHHPIDVIGSVVIAGLAGYLADWGVKKYVRK